MPYMNMATLEIDIADIGHTGEIHTISPVVLENGSIVLVLSVHSKVGWHSSVQKVIAI